MFKYTCCTFSALPLHKRLADGLQQARVLRRQRRMSQWGGQPRGMMGRWPIGWSVAGFDTGQAGVNRSSSSACKSFHNIAAQPCRKMFIWGPFLHSFSCLALSCLLGRSVNHWELRINEKCISLFLLKMMCFKQVLGIILFGIKVIKLSKHTRE